VKLGKEVMSLVDGNGDGEVNRVFADVQTAASSVVDVDFYDFAGERDELGRTFALSRVKFFGVWNTHATETLRLSPSVGNGNFTNLVPANKDIEAGGFLFFYTPPGAAVVDTSQHILQISDTLYGTNPFSYKLLALGSQ